MLIAAESQRRLIPPADGLLPAFVGQLDFHAEYNPSVPWAVFPWSGEVREISYLQLAHASHRVAHLLRPGRAGPDGQVIALLLHCDNVHYGAVILGCIRAGLVVRTRNTDFLR